MRHRKTTLSLCALCVLMSITSPHVQAEEPDDSRIVEQILRTREMILQTATNAGFPEKAVFLAFWDFDGTILKGDCSEGLRDGPRTVYPGLAQVAIENGLSQLYPRDGGFQRFWTDYTNMDQRVGQWLAYPFIPQMLRGANADEVLKLSETHFVGTLSNYLMASSIQIIRALERGGVQSHILSASADLFVKGASQSLGIPADRIHGIETRTREGRLTEELVYPVTWNLGKLERLRQIIAAVEKTSDGKRAFVLAGFGDSYGTDGPFLKFITLQKLPAGAPLAVFYGEQPAPAEYAGLFYHARHTTTVSGK